MSNDTPKNRGSNEVLLEELRRAKRWVRISLLLYERGMYVVTFM